MIFCQELLTDPINDIIPVKKTISSDLKRLSFCSGDLVKEKNQQLKLTKLFAMLMMSYCSVEEQSRNKKTLKTEKEKV